MLTFFKKVLGINELSHLQLQAAALPFHYNNQVFQRCNGSICDINGEQGMFFIYLNDRIPSNHRYQIGVILGDLAHIRGSNTISVNHNSQLKLWELSIVEEISMGDEQDNIDLFLPEGLEEDQRLSFANGELASQWRRILMNTIEINKRIREIDQQWNVREGDNLPVRDSIFDFIDQQLINQP